MFFAMFRNCVERFGAWRKIPCPSRSNARALLVFEMGGFRIQTNPYARRRRGWPANLEQTSISAFRMPSEAKARAGRGAPSG